MLSSVPKGYKLIREEDDDIVEIKNDVQSPPRVRLNTAHPSLKLGKGARPVVAYLSYYGSRAGSANTDFAFAYNLEPSNDSSWAAWQATFDEVRVLSAELHWNVAYTIAPTTAPAQSANAVVAYQPSSTTSITSVNAGLQYEKFQLVDIQIPGTSYPYTSPQAHTPNGRLVFHCKVPSTTLLSNVVTTDSAGMWRPTTDNVVYSWGSFLGYCAQGGATSVLQAQAFVRMKCEFRCRR